MEVAERGSQSRVIQGERVSGFFAHLPPVGAVPWALTTNLDSKI